MRRAVPHRRGAAPAIPLPSLMPSRPSLSRAARGARPPARRRAAPERAGTFAELPRAVDGVRRLVRGLRLAEQRTRAESGLSAPQLFVLGQLVESAAASLSELAARTLTDRTSVAAVVARLEEMGLVASERSASDRRRVLVRITAGGRRRLQAAPQPPTALLLDALGRLTRAELRGLTRHLERLVAEMGLADEPAGMLFEERARSVAT
jgi:DNA-binding MarR family transcriptional regulator